MKTIYKHVNVAQKSNEIDNDKANEVELAFDDKNNNE